MGSEVEPATLSVVVPSVNGWDDLRGCLAALEDQRRDAALEVLVADRVGEPVRAAVAREFPRVKLLPAAPGTTIPALRALGFGAATGTGVAVIEDHVLVPPGWARAMMGCLARGEDVAGGAVENAATERLVDRAAFLCEYHHLLPPLPAGPVDGLAGNNTVYRRSLLGRFEESWRAERWENHLHDALRRTGVTLQQHPEIVVRHRMHYTLAGYLSQRFLFSRAWAGMEAAGRAGPVRLARGAAALALPPILLARISRAAWARPAHRGELARSLPLIGLFVLAWAAGEVVGWWFGAGDALARVR